MKAASGAIWEKSKEMLVANGTTDWYLMKMEEALSFTCSELFYESGTSDLFLDDGVTWQRS